MEQLIAMSKATERGRSPMARALERLPQPLRSVVEQAREGQDYLLFAGSLAFYALVSVAPLAIMVMWLTSLVVGDERLRQVAATLRDVAPAEIGADTALQRVADLGTGLGITAVLAGLWPATSYGAGLVRAFDRLSPERGRPLKGLRGRGLALVVLLPMFVAGTVVAAFGAWQALGSGLLGRTVGIVLALGAAFVGGSVALVVIYRIFPPEPLGWRSILEATAVTAAGISVLSFVFALYIEVGANFEDHYASSGLAGIVLLAVWLFLANALLLVGYRVALERRSRQGARSSRRAQRK